MPFPTAPPVLDAAPANLQTKPQSTAFAHLLRDRGVTPMFYPCIAFAPPRNVAALDFTVAGIKKEMAALP